MRLDATITGKRPTSKSSTPGKAYSPTKHSTDSTAKPTTYSTSSSSTYDSTCLEPALVLAL